MDDKGKLLTDDPQFIQAMDQLRDAARRADAETRGSTAATTTTLNSPPAPTKKKPKPNSRSSLRASPSSWASGRPP